MIGDLILTYATPSLFFLETASLVLGVIASVLIFDAHFAGSRRDAFNAPVGPNSDALS
ncbi:hypothetical protein [Sphingomonas profundi]|uniref:hypothetical protein n=1 Tax=Alterirhizorhabdus profundi TaxID=2681549 RepID=UPI0012E834C8|nr:hypothetical protein [Sphingomonas profundi]